VIPAPAALVGCVVVWVLGLVGLGTRDRRRWNGMVGASSFQRQPGSGPADLERTVDGRYVIRGSEANVSRIRSAEVGRGLLELDAPGRRRITGDAVAYETPFTRLTATELETTDALVVLLAKRVERLAGSRTSRADKQGTYPRRPSSPRPRPGGESETNSRPRRSSSPAARSVTDGATRSPRTVASACSSRESAST